MRPVKKSVLRIESLEDRCLLSGDLIGRWNELLLQSLPGQPPRVPLVRNMALVHVAMFDAVNTIDRSYEPYFARVHASRGASQEAAAAQAARDTLVALYPAQQAVFDQALAEDLAGIPRGRARQGIAVGQEVARQILALRSNDGASAIMSYTPPNEDPGQWQPTPPDFSPAGNVHVPFITPFAVASTSQFRPGPPPALTSPAYAAHFNEAKALGSIDSTDRTADQTQAALVWRLPLTNHQVWNRIAQGMAAARGNTLVQNTRLFALMNMAMNDGLQTSFASKYHYALWRPVTAIRRAAEDGNPATDPDPNWTTLHPTTPPYPTYAGNASTIGASCATVLAAVFGTDHITFQVRWDAYGFLGVTRSYAGFWAAADEEARSRIYGGIHFTFDSIAGQGIGVNVGEHVVDNYLLPRGRGQGGHAGAGPLDPSVLAGPGLVAPALFAGRDPFSHGAVTRTTPRSQTPTVADAGWLVALTPPKDSEFTAPSNQGEEARIDLLIARASEIGHLHSLDPHAERVLAEALTAGTRPSP